MKTENSKVDRFCPACKKRLYYEPTRKHSYWCEHCQLFVVIGDSLTAKEALKDISYKDIIKELKERGEQ